MNRELPIHDMWQRHRGLTVAIAEHQTEAARVSLDKDNQPGATFQVFRPKDVTVLVVNWAPTDRQTQFAWNNENYATEHGAYACVLAAVELLCGLECIGRAETGSGVDFYMAPPNTAIDDLENHIRLEISGIIRRDASEVRSRLREKLMQANEGNSNLPAMAGVIGFRAKQIRLARLET